MRVEEVKTSFIADTQKYIKDIQKAQKVLNTFLNTNDMTKKEKAENRLQVAIQKRAQAQAKALMEELKYKRQVDATNSKLASSQNNVNKSISKSSSSSKMFAGELAHMARNVMTLYYSFKSLSQVLTTGIDFNKTKEDARLAFTVMFRSADVASQKIRELQEYAVASPLSFKETISASKQLSAYGFGAGELVSNMEMLGTVAKATGHSLDDIAYVYGTLRTQGRAYSRDLMQFSMRGIPIYEELAEVLRVDQKEIKKLTEEGKVGFKEVEKAFKNMTKEGGKFGGLLDEYMKGFSGIASQLEDTFQQSMGQLTAPLFEELKKQMQGIIRVMDSGKMDKTFKDIGEGLAELAKYLTPLVSTLVTLTPALIAFFKAWLAYVVISKASVIIASLPRLLRLVNVGIISMTRSMNAFNMSTWLGSIQKGFQSILAALRSFATAAWGIIAANPLLAAILGVVAIGTAIVVTVVHKQKEAMEKERERLSGSALMSYDLDPSKRGGVSLKALKDDVGLITADFEKFYDEFGVQQISIAVSGIEKMAKYYKISALEAVEVAHAQGLLSDLAYNTYISTQKNVSEMKRYKAAVAANKDLMVQNWLGETTGKSGSAYRTDIELEPVTSKIPGVQTDVYVSAGGTAADDYIAGLEQRLKDKESTLKYIWEGMYKPEMMADHIESSIEDIKKLLVEASQFTVDRGGKEIPWFNMTEWDEKMRRKLEELQKRLGDGKGKKAVEIKLDPWFDREKMASATKMIFDDLELQRDKDFANAQAKLDAQEISFEQYSRAINAIHTKYLDDRTEAEKEAVEKTMNLWRDGSEDAWRNISIDAHKELFAFLGDTRPIQNLWAAFTNGASRAVSSTINAFRHIKDLLGSFENPFSIGTSSSPIGIKIDIDKDVLESNAGNMWDKMVIFGNYIKEGFTIFKNNLSLFKESIIEFKESVLILGKNVAIEMIKGTQVGNVFSSASQYKADFLQKKKDEWIESGRDAGDFNEDFALAEGRSMGTYDQEANIKGSILTQAVMAFAEMALSVENVTKVLNPFGTMMEAAGTFLKPLLSVGFSGMASALEELGKVVGEVLLPVIMPLMIVLQTIAGVIKILIIPILQTVGAAFAWLYDSVLVPFGNFVIDAINTIIDLINKIPFVDIEKLERFQTTAQMLADSTESVNDTMQYMLSKLNKMIDEELQSLQDLYEVGAISGAELQSRTDELNLKRLSLEENTIDLNAAQLEEMQDIYDWLIENGAFPDIEALLAALKLGVDLPSGLQTPESTSFGGMNSAETAKQWEIANKLADSWGDKAGAIGTAAGALVGGVADIGVAIGTGVANLASNIGSGIASLFGFADGTSNIPYDMVANVHKGEGIIPATFMDSIRAGELMLSAGNTGGGGSVSNYYITVEGSVTSENDLADSLAEKIEQRRTRGYGRR